ncbi:MAG: DUF190 domain-containing protein [Verrucomicrobiota bacterium]|nr:DUF190 domain-containing protein [Verrucomicrobiota bacterium]
MIFKKGKLLRIFIGESNRFNGHPLYRHILEEAKKENLSGVTVLRGLEGFGTHKQMHSAKILSISQDLPIIVEIIDEESNILSFAKMISPTIKEGLLTLEDIEVAYCRVD